MIDKRALEVLDRLVATERELLELMSGDSLQFTTQGKIVAGMLAAASGLIQDTIKSMVRTGSLSPEQAQWYSAHALLILKTIEESQKRG